MHHMDCIIEIKGILCIGVKHRFFESHNFRKFAGFWCGYCCIKHDKTASIVSILIKGGGTIRWTMCPVMVEKFFSQQKT